MLGYNDERIKKLADFLEENKNDYLCGVGISIAFAGENGCKFHTDDGFQYNGWPDIKSFELPKEFAEHLLNECKKYLSAIQEESNVDNG